MFSSSPAPAFSRIRRGLLALAAATLLTTACSSTSSIEASGSDASQTPASAEDNSSNASAGSAQEPPVTDEQAQPSTSNPAALPTIPISAADVRVFRPNETVLRLVPVTPVVNTCGALSGAALTGIVAQLSTEFSFGNGPAFPDGELRGAACVYQSDTHGIGIIIGSANEVTVDASSNVTPVASGEVTGTPWATDPSVTVLSEDSFGLDTPFAAHTSTSEFGVIAYNASGTGIDFGSDGELFARMAQAAIAGVGAAGPVVPVDPAANIQTARPCDLFESSDFATFLGTTVADQEEVAPGGTECEWGDFETRPGGTVRLRIRHATDQASELAGLTPTANPAIHSNSAGGLFVVTDTAIIDVRVDITAESGNRDLDYNSDAAELEILTNIASRLVTS